jgi:hypothetical protein
VMALSAQSMGSLLALDEFDVFMDEKNRNLCFSVLCAEVSRSTVLVVNVTFCALRRCGRRSFSVLVAQQRVPSSILPRSNCI